MLPQDVRDELERRIVERAFSGYEEMAGWLQAQGYQIAENSVQRYGTRLCQKIEAFELTSDGRLQQLWGITTDDDKLTDDIRRKRRTVELNETTSFPFTFRIFDAIEVHVNIQTWLVSTALLSDK